MRTLATAMTLAISTAAGLAQAGSPPPQAEISNSSLKVHFYLPDKTIGYYRGTRFDWGGVIGSLVYQGHNYYGPWYTKTDPHVSDFIYQGADIIAGPCSAITGPVEEFAKPQGYDDAKAGGTFLKIGVGILRKPDDQPYSAYHLYDIVNGGKWTAIPSHDAVTFTQELHDQVSGYAYEYTKKISLEPGKPVMLITHSLKNLGSKPLFTRVYDHNFLVLDHQPTGPDFTVTFPFKVTSAPPLDKGLAEFRDHSMVYLKTLTDEERVYTPIEGFGKSAADYKIQIDNKKVGAGMTVTADQPLSEMALWSIRSVLSVEPFIAISLAPGETTAWTYTYTYHVAQ